MRGKKAKKIRREVYGDDAIRERTYTHATRVKEYRLADGTIVRPLGQRVDEKRSKYQRAKKETR